MGRGGVQSVVVNLARGMSALGVDVDIVTWGSGLGYPLPERARHLPFEILGVSRSTARSRALRRLGRLLLGTRPFRFLFSSWFTRQLVARGFDPGAYDAIYLHGLYCLPFWRLRVAHCFVVIHNHQTASTLDSRFPWVNAARRRMYARAYGGRVVVTVSRGVSEDLVSGFGLADADVHCIPNPLDLTEIRKRAQEPIESELAARPFVVAVGRLTAQKRFDRLIRAYQMADVTHDLVIAWLVEVNSFLLSKLAMAKSRIFWL